LSTVTTLTGLVKPAGTEPFARSILNTNMDTVDKNLIMLLMGGVPYANFTIGDMVFDGNGMPQSQAFSNNNGLAATVTYSWTDTTLTMTISQTAPDVASETITINLNTLGGTGVAS